ncbi:FKBP-type peptidyl-prolyl cis-trans isomerase [Bacteroides sp. 519]|uniref:FKBP-type peptidyl-prolyl cis-trans isomerase n=1 Tax=Bacteroides sp. 519 TaxID=2302937 RepID=UPI0013D8DE83|nr:FKBP-type peptidyl-prolyl cis-trans isomerase [Bacteroides sp. 519]NDV60026.1 FKBP-type peptidyl-prolyl cis-trans isomerase [Bacteroides sp. 519]
MKKVSILMIIAAAMSFVSCAQAPKAQLKTDVDSLSYSIGMARTDGLMNWLVGQVKMDTTYMDDFMRGFIAGSQGITDKDIAYATGLSLGQNVSKNWVEGFNQQLFSGDSTKTLTRDDMIAGFVAGVTGKDMKMQLMEAQSYMETNMQKIAEKAIEEKYGENKKAGEDFLAANKDKEGVITTESGLQYKVITEGTGSIPEKTDRVVVNYRGTLVDGTEFDSSYSRNEPFKTLVGRGIIQGWTEALSLMPVGSKWEIYIPYDLAYGTQDKGQIKPFSTLIFEMELLEIETKK